MYTCYLVINERSLRNPDVVGLTSASLVTSLAESPSPRSRLCADERRDDVTDADLTFRCRLTAVSRDVSPTIDFDRVTVGVERRDVVGVCDPDADVTERRCVVGVVALPSMDALRVRRGVVAVRTVDALFRFKPGDLGASVAEVRLDDGSSGVAGSILRATLGECDVTALARLRGGADHLLRLSRIDPVRTKFWRSGAFDVIVNAFVVSVMDRCRAAARRDVTSAADGDARACCAHAE